MKKSAQIVLGMNVLNRVSYTNYLLNSKHMQTADLTTGQNTIIDPLHRMGKPQRFMAKEAGCSQSDPCVQTMESLLEEQNVAGEDEQAKEMTVDWSICDLLF